MKHVEVLTKLLVLYTLRKSDREIASCQVNQEFPEILTNYLYCIHSGKSHGGMASCQVNQAVGSSDATKEERSNFKREI